MCGIAGSVNWINPNQNDLTNIKKIIRHLGHRGPDFSSTLNFGSATLGHSRLAIIDLNKSANQPMMDSSQRFVICFNGEIYNYRELKNQLEKRGVLFKTKSDTEVILESYKLWKEDCLKKFEGMFAFAIWDKKLEQLFIARDRIGEKPLFYIPLQKNNFKTGIIFSSELRALLKHSFVDFSLNKQGVWDFLSLNYMLGSSSIIDNVRKLEPAHYLIYSKNKNIEKKYWNLENFFYEKKEFKSKEVALEEFNCLLDSKIKDQQISDVPLGAFLSGGIDSSTVVSTMSKTKKQKFSTFCIGFDEESYNEIPQSEYVAKYFNLNNFSKVISMNIKRDFIDILNKSSDEPLADTSILPMFYLSKFAKNKVTVCLSGDGADELFIGYETYLANQIREIFKIIPDNLMQAMSYISKFIPVSHKKVSFDYKLKQFLSGHSLKKEKAHYWWRIIFPEEMKLQLLDNDFNENLLDPFHRFDKFFKDVKDCDFIDQVSYVDIKTWLVDNILVKLDRTSMANSLECRSPFLNHKIVEFAAALPAKWKFNNFQKKKFLKESQKKFLPTNVLNMKKKGFNSPISMWFNEQLKDISKEIIYDSSLTDFVSKTYINKIWKEHENKIFDHGYRLFSLTCLGNWLNFNKGN